MKVLGIADNMTGGAALIENGQIVYAVHEERLTRAKMAVGFPRESISRVLRDTHTDPKEVDAVAVATVSEFFRPEAAPYNGWFVHDEPALKAALLSASSQVTRVLGGRRFLKDSYYQAKIFLGKARRKSMEQVLRRDWELACPIKFIDHHFAHACSAYFTAGLQEATVITLDGAGDNASSRVYWVKDGRFKRLWNVDSFDSIGNYYGYVTHICGFRAHRHEGKITGLAAYGEPVYADLLKQFIDFTDGTIVNKSQLFHRAAVHAIEKALPRSYKREDLAASMQTVLEDVACDYISHWTEKSGCGDLALAGGVFANVKLNQRIHRLESVRSLFIHPAMGDEGLAVGAAFAVSAPQGGEGVSRRLADVYLGCEFSDRDIEAAIGGSGLRAEFVPDMEQRVARELAAGSVVARFDGRMEYGPRALGNRSILYQATDPTVNDWLNKRLKRTEFMPFAPVTLAEFADRCYVGLDGVRDAARFMTITVNCTEWLRKYCPAVVHVDGTARPQIIQQDTNPGYYRIVDEYRKLTGLPALINTSFNLHEEPIVCTPEDAVRAFREGAIDFLAMGHYLLEHPAARRPRDPIRSGSAAVR